MFTFPFISTFYLNCHIFILNFVSKWLIFKTVFFFNTYIKILLNYDFFHFQDPFTLLIFARLFSDLNIFKTVSVCLFHPVSFKEKQTSVANFTNISWIVFAPVDLQCFFDIWQKVYCIKVECNFPFWELVELCEIMLVKYLSQMFSTRCQFHQCSTYSFCTRGSRKRKKYSLVISVFLRFRDLKLL